MSVSQPNFQPAEENTRRDQAPGAPDNTVVGDTRPTQNIINYIWGSIISGILLVFIASGLGILVSIFIGKDANAIQPLITLFTATLGFLAGVLTPSPVRNQGGQ
jgi:ABC-type phosphate transport system permease subunit